MMIWLWKYHLAIRKWDIRKASSATLYHLIPILCSRTVVSGMQAEYKIDHALMTLSLPARRLPMFLRTIIHSKNEVVLRRFFQK